MKKFLASLLVVVILFLSIPAKAEELPTIYIDSNSKMVTYTYTIDEPEKYSIGISGHSVSKGNVLINGNEVSVELNVLDLGESNILIYQNEANFQIIRVDVFTPTQIAIKKIADEPKTSTYMVVLDGIENVYGDFIWTFNNQEVTAGSTITIDKTNLDTIVVKTGELTADYVDYANSLLAKILIVGLGVPIILVLIYFILKFAIAGDPYKELIGRSKKLNTLLNKALISIKEKNKKTKKILFKSAYYSQDMTNVCRIIQTQNDFEGQALKSMAQKIIEVLRSYEISHTTISISDTKNIIKYVIDKNDELFKTVNEYYSKKPSKKEKKRHLKDIKSKIIKDAEISKANDELNAARYHLETLELIKTKNKK